MKRLVGLFFTLVISSSVSAQIKPSDEQQIKDLIQNAFDGVWSDFDTTALDKFHTRDFLLLEHGEVWTNDIIKQYQTRGRQNLVGTKRINNFEFIKIDVNENTAWCAYKNFATITKGDEVIRNLEWLESANAIKTKDGWKLVLMHSTRVVRK